ncbi:MAG: metallophosphoesterase, partial [Muribaculaceae bacterium]|nr:metallophosphoesterase [Muribaculaceae bacterium]
TFGNQTKFVSRLVDEINNLNPDLIVFTGDIVNRNSNELIPFVSVLSRLQAKEGVISIMGNHDYGDYTTWESDKAKQENLKLLHNLEKKMGWDLLLNQSKNIYRGNDSILIIGVENIGDPPFHVYGSLEKAYANTSTPQTKILLSHNPAHWKNSIADNPGHKIDLTLSGHTHAMQVELLGMSPAVFRYPTWSGLYHDKTTSNRLYVNIGAGTVGLPMRIGATPEITLITLRRAY